MEDHAVKRLALVLATQAEIEGMKAVNDQVKHDNHPPPNGSHAFEILARRLTRIASMTPEELDKV